MSLPCHLIHKTEQAERTDESISPVHRPRSHLHPRTLIGQWWRRVDQWEPGWDNWCIQLTRLHYGLDSSSRLEMQLAGAGFGGITPRATVQITLLFYWMEYWGSTPAPSTGQFPNWGLLGGNCWCVHNRPDENRWNKPLNLVKCVSPPISVTIELHRLCCWLGTVETEWRL